MKIRLAKSSDATRIANIYLESFKKALPTVKLAHTDDEVREWYRNDLIPKGGTWIAEENNKIFGFMSLDGDTLEELYLVPKFQGSGIGSQLIKKAKELNPIGLQTYTFQINSIARKFYEEHGFVAMGFNNGKHNEENEPDVLYKWNGGGK